MRSAAAGPEQEPSDLESWVAAVSDDEEEASWGGYRRLILGELKRISNEIESVNNKIDTFRQQDVAQMKTDIALLKFQAAIYGAVSGMVMTAIVSVAVKFLH